jgi:hypothetical protein
MKLVLKLGVHERNALCVTPDFSPWNGLTEFHEIMYEHTANRCLIEVLLKVPMTRKNNTADERNCEVEVPINFGCCKCVRK